MLNIASASVMALGAAGLVGGPATLGLALPLAAAEVGSDSIAAPSGGAVVAAPGTATGPAAIRPQTVQYPSSTSPLQPGVALQSSLSVTTETPALSDKRGKAGRRLATLPMKTDPVVPRPESGVSGRPPSPWALIVDYAVETPDSARARQVDFTA